MSILLLRPKKKKKSGNITGVLTTLGITSSQVAYTFSPYKKLFSGANHNAIRVNNMNTLESKHFQFGSDGNIDSTAIMTWLNGAIGVVDWICNEANPDYPATQSNLSKAPQISDGTNFHANGLKFNGSSYLSISGYANLYAVNINKFTMFTKFNPSATLTGYIFSINSYLFSNYITSSANSQYIGFSTRINGATPLANNNNDAIFTWNSGANGLKNKTNDTETLATYENSVALTGNITIGCRSNIANYYDGYLKNITIFNTDKYSLYNDFRTNL